MTEKEAPSKEELIELLKQILPKYKSTKITTRWLKGNAGSNKRTNNRNTLTRR